MSSPSSGRVHAVPSLGHSRSQFMEDICFALRVGQFPFLCPFPSSALHLLMDVVGCGASHTSMHAHASAHTHTPVHTLS